MTLLQQTKLYMFALHRFIETNTLHRVCTLQTEQHQQVLQKAVFVTNSKDPLDLLIIVQQDLTNLLYFQDFSSMQCKL